MGFSPYTPNIDSSILGKIQTPDILGGIQQGMKIRQGIDQRRDDRQLKTDMTAATQGLDPTTEQGMAEVAARLLKSGHQAEALQIHKMAMDLHEKSGKTYQQADFGEQGMGSFDASTGKYAMPTAQPPASPYGDTQSMGSQAPPMISRAPMAPDAPQGMGMPQAQPSPAPVPQAAPITSAAYQKSKAEFDLKKAARDADAAFKADIPNYEGQIKSIGSDMSQRDLIASQIMAKHGGSALAKEYVASVLKPNAQPNTFASAKLIGSYLSDFRPVQKNYQTVAQPYLALQGIKKSKAYGTGVGDQSMIDKLIILETGKVPTEAQYFQFANNLGFADKIDKVTGRLKSGAILGGDARDRMMSEAEEQMKIAHDAYDKAMEEQSAIMGAAGVDPKTVIRPGGFYNEVKKNLTANAAPAPAAGQVAEPKSKSDFDALPAGALWKDSQGQTHKKK